MTASWNSVYIGEVSWLEILLRDRIPQSGRDYRAKVNSYTSQLGPKAFFSKESQQQSQASGHENTTFEHQLQQWQKYFNRNAQRLLKRASILKSKFEKVLKVFPTV